MNLKVRRSSIIKAGIIAFVSFLVGVIIADTLHDLNSVYSKVQTDTLTSSPTTIPDQSKKDEKDTPIYREQKPSFQEVSPDGFQKVSVYKQDFDSDFFDNKSYFTSDKIVMLVDFNDLSSRRIVFAGDERSGDPHWLGNDHIFFTVHCGTSCQGLYLIKTSSKKTLTGGLAYIFDAEGNWITQFHDWFGHDFRMKGFMKNMRSEIHDDNIYLILEMVDEKETPLGEKRFLFTGTALQAVN